MYWSAALVALVPPEGGDGDVDGAGAPAGAVAVMVVGAVDGEGGRRGGAEVDGGGAGEVGAGDRDDCRRPTRARRSGLTPVTVGRAAT